MHTTIVHHLMSSMSRLGPIFVSEPGSETRPICTLTECLCLMRPIALGIVMADLGCSVSDVDAILACFAATVYYLCCTATGSSPL